MLDVGFDKQQTTYATALSAFCAKHGETWASAPRGEFPRDAWSGIAELGVLGLAMEDSGATALDLMAAHQALGAGGCPGPHWQTVLAVGVLAGKELDDVAEGELIVSVGTEHLLPWPSDADITLDGSDLVPGGGELWRTVVQGIDREVMMLGHELWGSVRWERRARLVVSGRSRALADLVLGAHLVGAGARVLKDVGEYVRVRSQFRTVLSEFQSVAHPLAECDARIVAAAAMLRRAASLIDRGDELPAGQARTYAGMALGSAARAARRAVYQAHQAYGGIGFTEEGPLSWFGPRIGQMSTEAEARWRRPSVDDLVAFVGVDIS
jgi:alkylation response protein AidB-like acyl-CoA dehydrogenase